MSGGHGVGRAGLHVHAQDGAEQVGAILAPALGIAARPAVAQAEIEHPVRAEQQLSPVVVGVGLSGGQDDLFAGRVGDVGVG